jgi:hypothetical protein
MCSSYTFITSWLGYVVWVYVSHLVYSQNIASPQSMFPFFNECFPKRCDSSAHLRHHFRICVEWVYNRVLVIFRIKLKFNIFHYFILFSLLFWILGKISSESSVTERRRRDVFFCWLGDPYAHRSGSVLSVAFSFRFLDRSASSSPW